MPRVHAALVTTGLLLALALRATHLDGPAYGYDELYHVFVAKSLLAGDGFVLPSGRPYTRGALVSLLTAGAFGLFGEHEWAARLPSLLFGMGTLALLYLAGRALFGPAAGLVALFLLALSPEAVDADRYARMYSPLAFFGLLAALAAFQGLERPGWRWPAVAVAALAVAAHLHPVALGLLPVVASYAALRVGGAAVARRPAPRRHLTALVACLALAAAVAFPAAWRVVETAVLTPLPWYQPTAGDALFYHRHLTVTYGWLWVLVWPATVAAVLARPAPGLFVGLAFWLPFVAVSAVVATKHLRYVVHLLPFAWLLVGAAAGLLAAVVRDAAAARLRPALGVSVPDGLLATMVLVVTLLPLVVVLPSARAALSRPRQTEGAFTTGRVEDWRGLARELVPRLDPEARLVTRVQLASRYYLGKPAYHLIGARSRRGSGDWERPRRSADGQVQHAGDLRRLRAQGAPVWLVVERWRWAESDYVDESLKAAAARECRPVPVARVAFVVFACDALPREP